MSNFAIVIGIDAYANPEWNLGAAVQDALRFVEWATGPGGVPDDPAHLRLLLSSAKPDLALPPHQPATSENITRAILDFQDGAGKDGERLYVYYAGHGVSSPDATRGGPPEPCIIPADVREMRVHANLLIPFSHIIPLLSKVGPKEQFFFIDACRDFALEDYRPSISPTPMRWNPPISDPGPQSAQFVLYATSAGQKAVESVRGQGAFGGALLEGLKGAGPAKIWVQPPPRYEVRFRTLVPFVRKRVRTVIERLAQANAAQFIQIPEREAIGGGEEIDPLLATLDVDDVEKVTVLVRMTPKAARERGRIRIIDYSTGGEENVRAELPPTGNGASAGLPVAAELGLPPGEYIAVATADEFQERREPFVAYEAITLDFTMEPAVVAEQTLEVGLEKLGTKLIPEEMVGLEEIVLLREGPVRALEEVREAPRGGLAVSSADRSLVIVVRDGQRQLVSGGVGTGSLRLQSLVPGIYSVQPVLPDGSLEERTVEVRAGETTTLALSLDTPALQVGSDQASMLAALGISADAGSFLDSAEHLGPVADTKLASLLGFAAFAAHWQGGGFDRLRTLGVTAMQGVPDGEAGLLVLLGAAGDQPAAGLDPAQFLAAGQLVARTLSNEVLDEGGFAPLSGFAAAAQRQTRVPVGQIKVELRLPNLAPTHYALAALPNRVTVLVVVAEESGGFEIQQYLVPLGSAGARPEDFLMADPGNIRRLELAQRYYAAGHNVLSDIVSDPDLDALLYGKWLDPLLGCIAGYTLLRRGMAERYVGQLGSSNPDPLALELSAMRNMLKFFPDLPDSHVLAGLAEPKRRAEHYANALQRGLPVFADGFRALYAWRQEQPGEVPALLAEAGSGLVPTSVWTAWVQVLRFANGSGLTPEQQHELQGTVGSFVDYLTEIGFRPPTGQVDVSIWTEYPDNAAYISAENVIRIGKALAGDPDVAVHEYAHHALGELLPQGEAVARGNDAVGIQHGLADYYTCSFSGDPRLGRIWRPPNGIRNLDNSKTFADLSSDVLKRNAHVAGEIWGAAFWELRSRLEQERADRALFTAWSAQELAASRQLTAASFVQRLLAAVAADGGPDVADQLRELFARRGVVLKAEA